MKTIYSKPCTLPQDLILLLKSRGLSIPNEQRAICYLTNIGYFRLSAYLYPLLEEPKTSHRYKGGATFDMALDMYRFDRKLRVLLFNELEKIEVAIRSAMNNWISDALNDVFWMTNASYFNNPVIFEKRLSIIQSELERTNEEFITHFYAKYNNPFPPVWMLAEIIPFGILCSIFNNLKYKSIQKKVATCFGLPIPAFSSWMVSLVGLRNLCGHHNRTWNKEIPLVPAPLKNPAFPWIDTSSTDPKRVYFRICIIKYLLFTVSPNNSFTQKLKSLLAEYPSIDVRAMGFPVNWQNAPLWQ
ncbi:MAG: Abi family protein [Prevotellaceae bacterium]|jgi:abortive infection bacteriophage resistance protein|nr:Abi family protein [Prevotellaceae bacterium]